MTFISSFPINNLNIPKIVFRGEQNTPVQSFSQQSDKYSTNPIYENLGTKAQIEASAKTNPEINRILAEHNLPLKVNIEELEKLQKGHLKDTRLTVAKMYSALPPDLKSEVNLQDLQEAAMFHDYGKILIPNSILNKPDKFTDDEREIMNLHSELGYELLKDKGLSQNALNMIKYHHQNPEGDGYPQINNEFSYGIQEQMLNAADKYCALKEERSYKGAMSDKEALDLIKQDVENGQIDETVYDALVKSTKT
jgi:HD-GYP domain-containing protein (c-di-GMP phosphodiesterase class II)